MSSQDTHKTTDFSDVTIVDKVNQAKFDVYLAQSSSTGRSFALKVFPYVDDRVNPFFINETRFTNLSHPNIISTLHSVRSKSANVDGQRSKISYTIMEFAPHGDFFDAVLTKGIKFDEKLTRTYFYQLINGLDYLHSKNVAHMDLKPENLLLGDKFQLKVCDFDSSVRISQQSMFTVGTCNYRAPEVFEESCKNFAAADIYSAAIILFFLKCGGVLPHLEHEKFGGCDLLDLLNNHKELFWKKHCRVQGKPTNFFSEEFQSLFDIMTKANPEERATLTQVKESAWFNGPVYTDEELERLMTQIFNL